MARKKPGHIGITLEWDAWGGIVDSLYISLLFHESRH